MLLSDFIFFIIIFYYIKLESYLLFVSLLKKYRIIKFVKQTIIIIIIDIHKD